MNDNHNPWGNLNRPHNHTPHRPWEDSHRFGDSYPSPPPGSNPLRRLLRQNANGVCAALALVFAVAPVFGFIMQLLFVIFPGFAVFIFGLSPAGLGLINMIVFAVALLVPTLFIMRFYRIPTGVALPMRRTPAHLTVSGVFCALGASVVGVYIAVMLSAIISAATGATPTMPDFSPPEYGVSATIVFLISLSVIPAVFEELLFRGAIMQSLRRFGDPFALVVSSILFAMLHRNLLQGPNALITGLVLGYFTLRTGSLIPAIVAHFVNNLIVGGMSVIMLHIPGHYADMLNFSIIPAYLVLGGIGLAIMSRKGGGFVPLRQSPTGLLEGQKYLLFFTSPLALVFIAATIWQTWQFIN